MEESSYIPKSSWKAYQRRAASAGRRRASGRTRDGRTQMCRAWTLRGVENPTATHEWVPRNAHRRVTGDAELYVAMPCKCWKCKQCGPRKAMRYRNNILRAIEKYRLYRMLTLTLDPQKLTSSEDERQTFYEHLEQN